ncbi:alpha/beta hydrolase [Aquamicrobium segne]|uniref:Alpha/beta hydrolase n=1 Tax=Aquamicrobium segne TaxID=469547 RepID=A0ABW0H0L0_9HYPH
MAAGAIRSITMNVYREFSQAELDHEYDVFQCVPAANLQAYRARWADQNVEARASTHCAFDIRYAEGERSLLDVYHFGRSDPRPVQIYIHGGFWHMNSREEASYVSAGLRGAGYVTVVPGYDLVPRGSIPSQVRQLSQAVLWVRRNIRHYGGDPSDIHLIGHSAGAHLAAMLLTLDTTAIDPAFASGIRSANLISGMFDLEPIRKSSLNAKLGLRVEDIAAISPSRLRPFVRDLTLRLAVGSEESGEFFRQACELAAAWRDAIPAIELTNVAGCDHFSIRAELYHPRSTVTRFVTQ